MKKFLLGFSIFLIGSIGVLITYVYTLIHQATINGKEGWIVNFIYNDTGIPILFFLIIVAVGIWICAEDIKKDENQQ